MRKSAKFEIRSAVLFAAIGAIAGYFLYVGLHDGLVPFRRGGWTTYEQSPLQFVIELSGFVIVTVFCACYAIRLPIRLKADRDWIAQRLTQSHFEQAEFRATLETQDSFPRGDDLD